MNKEIFIDNYVEDWAIQDMTPTPQEKFKFNGGFWVFTIIMAVIVFIIIVEASRCFDEGKIDHSHQIADGRITKKTYSNDYYTFKYEFNVDGAPYKGTSCETLPFRL